MYYRVIFLNNGVKEVKRFIEEINSLCTSIFGSP